MSLRKRLNEDLKDAMRSKHASRRDTYRGLLAAVKQVEVDQQQELDDDGIVKVLMAEAKKRREAIESYESAGRADDAHAEQVELSLIGEYLPEQMSRDAIRAIAETVISEVGATSMKDMGKIMPAVMSKVKGQADGRLVSEVVREMLS